MRQPRSAFPAALLALVLGAAGPAGAQTCFTYVNTDANAPLLCREQGNLATDCEWSGVSNGRDCHEDADVGDCCTSIPAPAGSQSVLEMHSAWHECFGSVGDSDGDNPPLRGNRWYAFHRQIEHDYNIWRESGNFCNPTAGSPQGCKIESVIWCPDMALTYGFDCDLAAGGTGCGSQDAVADDSVQDCDVGPGTNPCRPDGAICSSCQSFPQCLFVGGAGPDPCQSAASATCAGSNVSFPGKTELADFTTVEEVTTLLDDSFHGQMHGAVGTAGPCNDINSSGCSVRDPMFWRLHKAIDDVVRDWQDLNATDVMLVLDRSGSMDELDATGASKLDAALEAAGLFGELLEDARGDGQTNHIGIVSYASDAADPDRNLSPIDAGPGLLAGPFQDVLDEIAAATGSGCTGIGGGVEAAIGEICAGGDCSALPDPPPAGTNRRKSILLLTDGIENVPPCLAPAGGAGPTCGGECFGDQLAYANLYDTQVCAIGFGDAGSLNGDLLTLFAERQGGIYMQNPATDPDGGWIDLKDFFAKCFGQLTDEFLGLDPNGVLAPGQAASEAIEYTSCGDGKLTFVGGWKTAVERGELRLLIHAPNGDLVRPGGPAVETSTQPTWDFARLRLPYRGAATGLWQAHLVRRHRAFVNGFTSDSFAEPKAGVALVRREIQRLCPDGCARVLYFEDKTFGASAYREALDAETGTGLLGAVAATDRPAELARLLRREWDLIVYAHQEGEAREPYDGILAQRICAGQRAILTDTRGAAAAALLKCAGAADAGSRNHRRLEVAGELQAASLELRNPGHAIWSYGLVPAGTVAQATLDGRGAGIVVRADRGVEQRWFVDVLVRGLNKLQAHKPVSHFRTGGDLLPSVRVSPFTATAGGFDRVDARVEIERPLLGIGTLLARRGLDKERSIGDERLEPRAATLAALAAAHPGPIIPTTTATYPLFDDGTHGDLVAGNHYWSAQLPHVAGADGMYRYRFILDLEKDGCTTRRELVQSVFVEVGVDATASGVQVTPRDRPAAGGGFDVTLVPRDRLGNLWGPGRPGAIQCREADGCRCGGAAVVDRGDGSYSIPVQVEAGAGRCRIEAFGTVFDVAWGRRSASCAGLLAALDNPRIEAPLRNKLRLRVAAACEQMLAAQGDWSVAAVQTGSTLAEVLHEIESHADGELPAAELQELRRRLQDFAREGGLELRPVHPEH
ncbi:MAG TPA: vWA domain-containing protein [Thermoanaerobaculia bacterium]|nr:vWA domain-containing protein [Thermoanaerobaculia bacterium]